MKICIGSVRHIMIDFVVYIPEHISAFDNINISLFDIEARGNNGLLFDDLSNGYYVGHIFKTIRG